MHYTSLSEGINYIKGEKYEWFCGGSLVSFIYDSKFGEIFWRNEINVSISYIYLIGTVLHYRGGVSSEVNKIQLNIR